VAALQAVPLHDGLTRAEADAVLAQSVPEASVRSFLLQNLRLGAPPAWRVGLTEIAAALGDVEGWDGPADGRYDGPTLIVSGAQSSYVRPDDRPVIRTLFPAARFVAIKHAGHWVHADNQAAFLGVVEAFLSASGP
jgi:esterase